MRRISAVGAFAALLLSIGAISAADPTPAADDSSSPSFFQRMFGSSKPTPPPKKPKPVEKPPTPAEVAKQGDSEHQAYYKRLEFIDKLRLIAHGANDEALLRKADELERMATQILDKKFSGQQALMEKAKAAEVALEEKRNWGNSPSASNSSGGSVRRAPNGRPLVNQE